MTKYFRPMMVITGMMMTANIAQATASCGEVIDDLKAMQAAQKSISSSLISNHDSFASVLEEYAESLQVGGPMGPSVATKDAVKNMNESAKAFRVRGQSAQKLNIKMNEASDQVIAKAIECLKSK